MEESKPQTRRTQGGPGRPVRRGPSAGSASSSHVIDLRAAKPVPSPTAPMPLPPAGIGRRRPKAPLRPLAAPTQTLTPAADRPARTVRPKPLSTPSTAVPAISPPPEPSLPPRRFWPAFWRFLLLLIILSLLVIGGLYLYINYYRA